MEVWAGLFLASSGFRWWPWWFLACGCLTMLSASIVLKMGPSTQIIPNNVSISTNLNLNIASHSFFLFFFFFLPWSVTFVGSRFWVWAFLRGQDSVYHTAPLSELQTWVARGLLDAPPWMFKELLVFFLSISISQMLHGIYLH